jgi:hypothetical protein
MSRPRKTEGRGEFTRPRTQELLSTFLGIPFAPSPRPPAPRPPLGAPRERSRGVSEPGQGIGRSAWGAPRGRRTDGTGGLAAGALARGSGGGGDARRRRLSGEAERRQEPAHGVGLRHRAQDPPRAVTALTQHATSSANTRRRSELRPRPPLSPPARWPAPCVATMADGMTKEDYDATARP